MIIYMYLNVVTERAYIGQTVLTLADRIKGHWNSALKDGATSLFHRALRDWPDPELWTAVVLQHCYDELELDQAEAAWQHMCCTTDPGVGYNAKEESLVRSAARKRAGDSLTTTRKDSPIAGLSPEEAREWYREQGRRGGAKGRAPVKRKGEMTEEERARFREWGRLGAERARQKRMG